MEAADVISDAQVTYDVIYVPISSRVETDIGPDMKLGPRYVKAEHKNTEFL